MKYWTSDNSWYVIINTISAFEFIVELENIGCIFDYSYYTEKSLHDTEKMYISIKEITEELKDFFKLRYNFLKIY